MKDFDYFFRRPGKTDDTKATCTTSPTNIIIIISVNRIVAQRAGTNNQFSVLSTRNWSSLFSIQGEKSLLTFNQSNGLEPIVMYFNIINVSSVRGDVIQKKKRTSSPESFSESFYHLSRSKNLRKLFFAVIKFPDRPSQEERKVCWENLFLLAK